MAPPRAEAVRRGLARLGLTPVAGLPERSDARGEEPAIVPARLVEHSALRAVPVGPPGGVPEVVAFLDGTQRFEVVGYVGAAPLVLARIAAAVRERRGRRLRTVEALRRTLVLARADALAAAAGALDGCDTVALPDAEPVHPARDLLAAREAIDAARGALEREAGDRYRRASGAILVVDGSLSESPAWASDPAMVGVVKSHATLPFEGEDLTRYLRLPAGHRTSVFAPATRRVAPVFSWALRLWPWEGHDLLHGLVRVEAAPIEATLAAADALSRWLLAERSPLSTPDARWDRLLYGVHAVETRLRAAR